MDVLALLGEDAGVRALQYHAICMLNLCVHEGVGDCYPVYSDAIVITKVQELLPGELGAIIGDDRIWDPETEDYVLEKAHHLFGADFSHGPTTIHLVNLSTTTSRWVKPSGAFLKGP
jgi:hypothetical protein